MNYISKFITAFQFLTVIPIPWADKKSKVSLAESAVFFPAIGLFIGVASYATYLFLSRFLPFKVALTALLLTPLFLTGGLHLDGWSDFCDGFFSARRKEEVLAIMKDPHIGVMGVLGLLTLILVKYLTLYEMASQWRTFLLAMMVSRWVQVALAFFLPYAGSRQGMGSEFVGSIRLRDFSLATVFLFVIVFVFGISSFLKVFLLFAAVSLFGLYSWARIRGVTGDVLGAASELSEVLILLMAFVV